MLETAVRPLSAIDAIFTRRSVRSYSPQRLDRSTIHSLLDAAVQAPTAMHLEPWRFVVIQDRAALKRFSEVVKGHWGAEAPKYRELHAHGADDGRRFAEQFASPDFNVFYDAGTLILICAKPLGPFVAADCWLAAENLMLAAGALGLGTCCIGSATSALNSSAIKAALEVPADVEVVVPVIVGVPADDQPSACARKEPQILSWR